jgi:glycosyltransferase involved in cell wall biosynthesis
MRMRVCFLIRQLNEGGAQRQLLELVQGLDAVRFEVSVLTFYPGGIFWDKFSALPSLRLECLDKQGRLRNLAFLWRLARRLRQLRPQVLHGYLLGGNLFACAAKLFSPRLRVIWGIRTADAAAKMESGFDVRLRTLERMASHLPARIVVNSSAGMDYYSRNGFPAARMSMIPNGVDTGRFKPDANLRRQARSEWGLSEADLVIGMAGRLTPGKDHPTFLAAAAIFLARHSGCRFVIVGGGTGEYAGSLRILAGNLGLSSHLTWAGSRGDMERLYPAFDLFASASLVEGFPNAIAEAMACGVPVAATDAGDSASIIGNTGEIVKPRQPEAMARAWEAMLPRLGPGLSERVRARIVGEFGVGRLIDRTSELLETVGRTT